MHSSAVAWALLPASAPPFGTARLAPASSARSSARAGAASRVLMTAAASVSSSADIADAFDTVVMKTYGRYPVVVDRGLGCELWDLDGKRYLDFVAGIATCTLGHADPRLVDAVSKQMARLTHVSNLYYIPEQGALAKWLVDNSPCDFAFFCNSGAEANEAAIKLIRKYCNSKPDASPSATPVIITANQSFHGRTLAAITATGQPKYHAGFAPMVTGFEYTPYNDTSALRAKVDEIKASGGKLAGIMLEACQGEGGVIPGDPSFFRAARELCHANDALLAFDEVQVGMGRTGKLWGYEQLGVEPDLFTLAKGLGGGVPIGAMVCNTKANVFGPGDHASTFGGNPLACAAGLAVGNALLDDGVMQNSLDRGEQLRAGLEKISAASNGKIAEVRGWGLIVGVELSESAQCNAGQVVGVCQDRGLMLVPAGVKVVRFVPALVVTAEQVDEALSIFSQALASLK